MDILNKLKNFTSNHKKTLKIVLLVVFVVITVFVLWKNIQEIPPIESFNFYGFIGCSVFYFLYLLVASYRYLLILRALKFENARFFTWFKIYIIGRFISKFIPQGGNVYRGMILKSNHQFSYSNYASSLILFYWLDAILGFVVGLIVILLTDPDLALGSLKMSYLIGLLVVLTIIIPFGIMLYFSKRGIDLKLPGKFKNVSIDIIVSTFKSIKLPMIIKTSLLGLLSIFITTLTFYSSFYILGIDVGIAKTMIYVILLRLSMSFTITPGNLGIQELVLGLLTKLTGIGTGIGIIIAIIIRITTYFVLCVLSIGFSLKSINNKEKVKTLSF